MERAKLVEELAEALWLDRFPDDPWNGVSAFDKEDYRGHIRAALHRLEALGLVIVEKERLSDCERSLTIFDEGRSSEYWERR